MSLKFDSPTGGPVELNRRLPAIALWGISVFLMALSVWQFSVNGPLTWLCFLAYFAVYALFVFLSHTDVSRNQPFSIFFLILNFILEGLSIIGFIVVFQLEQNNKAAAFDHLRQLSTATFIGLLMLLEAPPTIGLLYALRYRFLKKDQ